MNKPTDPDHAGLSGETSLSTASLKQIAQKMQQISKDSFRYHVLQSVCQFKTSWIQLGQSLHSVWKDKLFRQWGYLTFEGYIANEIGIKKMTAMKLLRSYFFLEHEGPHYIKPGPAAEQLAVKTPGFEAVDMLRKIKSKKDVSEQEYLQLKNNVFEDGMDIQTLKKELSAVMRQKTDEEEESGARQAYEVKKILTALKSMKREMESKHLLSADIITLTTELIRRVEEDLQSR